MGGPHVLRLLSHNTIIIRTAAAAAAAAAAAGGGGGGGGGGGAPSLTSAVVQLRSLGEEAEVGEAEEGVIKVWLADACHCPGSVMFLFEGTFGAYLHTGVHSCYDPPPTSHHGRWRWRHCA